MTARLRYVPLNAFLVALTVVAVLGTVTSNSFAKPRDEVQLGDPDIGDQGPAKGSPQTVRQISSSVDKVHYFDSQQWRTWLALITALNKSYR